MAKVIIYPIPGDQINIVIPVGTLPLEEVAKKDVPDGTPYLIVDETDLPQDRTYRAAWYADFKNPHGIGLGFHKWFEQYKDKLDPTKILEIKND